MSKLMAKISQKSKYEIAGTIMLLAVFIAPFWVLAGHRQDIYVDKDASGAEDGSASHPYKTISKAIKAADKDTEIHVANGTYKENIVIKDGVEIFGEDEDKTIIKADNDNESVVEMKDDTEINKMTIEGGKNGIKVTDDEKVSIINCVIKDNDHDGIRIKSGSTKKSEAVSISENVIKNNGRAGIFSESRRLVIMENEITGNESDGIDLMAGTSAWIEDNEIKDNDGSGMRLVLDNSNVWTKSNTFYGNEREGVEINAFGKAGRIDLNKSKFYKNDRHGISRIQRGNFSQTIWNGLTIQGNNKYWINKLGDAPSVIRIF